MLLGMTSGAGKTDGGWKEKMIAGVISLSRGEETSSITQVAGLTSDKSKGRPCARTGGKKKDEKDAERCVAFLVETYGSRLLIASLFSLKEESTLIS